MKDVWIAGAAFVFVPSSDRRASSTGMPTCPSVGFCGAPRGLALVSPDGFSARYDLDRVTGRISRESHTLYGALIAGKVLVCPIANGGFATSWALFDLRSRGLAPVAMLFSWANPVMVQGAVLAGIALMDQLSPDPMEAIRTGDRVRVDPKTGRVEVIRSGVRSCNPTPNLGR